MTAIKLVAPPTCPVKWKRSGKPFAWLDESRKPVLSWFTGGKREFVRVVYPESKPHRNDKGLTVAGQPAETIWYEVKP